MRSTKACCSFSIVYDDLLVVVELGICRVQKHVVCRLTLAQLCVGLLARRGRDDAVVAVVVVVLTCRRLVLEEHLGLVAVEQLEVVGGLAIRVVEPLLGQLVYVRLSIAQFLIINNHNKQRYNK